MPNLINQTPFPRTTPQLPYSRWASLVDANVATWSPTWIVQRNSYRTPPLGRIARATHSIRGDTIGPEVMSEPIPPYSRWQSIIDADVAQRFISPIYQESSSFKALERRRVDKLRGFGDQNPGPSILDEPSPAPWEKFAVDSAVVFDPSVVTPTYYVADFMARAANKIDVRQVNQPDTDWIWDRNDDVIAQTIAPLFELQPKTISPERRKTFVSFVNEPDNSPWIYPNTAIAGFDAALWPAIARFSISNEVRKQAIINEPALSPWVWLENDNFVASVLPGILQPLKFRAPDPQRIDTRAIVEPYSIPWLWKISDDVIATIAPNLWVPKYLARDRERIDVREISEPEFGWVIVPNVPPYVPLDPKLWPAIVQQLNAIRTRSRNELSVITINVPGFGWVTGYIPAVVIATGSHEKRKWRRSG